MQKKYALIALILLIFGASAYAGALEVLSEPAGAEIIINHIRTGRYTPDTLTNLPNSELKVTLLLENYRYEERVVAIDRLKTTSLSFTQLSDFDTIAITGDSLFGILQLPIPPVQAPYLINEIIEDRENVILTNGIHHIEWDGGISYQPIDTFVEVRTARITTVDIPFLRRYGRVDLVIKPDSAAIHIDSTLLGVGKLKKPLPAGKHDVVLTSHGWLDSTYSILLFPGQTIRDTIELTVSPDRDGDGFHDTVDICPDLHGIYDGCPSIQKREEFRRISGHLSRTFKSAPFTIEFAPISFQMRYATDKKFREKLSLFNDGSALLNNYRGVALCNKVWLSRGLFIGSVDIGYSLSALRYEKQWEIPISEDGNQLLIYDKYSDENPEYRIFSSGFQAGIQLHSNIISFAFLTGYLYETIELRNVTQLDPVSGDTTLVTLKDNNSIWNTTVRTTLTIKDAPLFPRAYSEISFTPRSDDVTGWIDFRVGIIVPWWRSER